MEMMIERRRELGILLSNMFAQHNLPMDIYDYQMSWFGYQRLEIIFNYQPIYDFFNHSSYCVKFIEWSMGERSLWSCRLNKICPEFQLVLI